MVIVLQISLRSILAVLNHFPLFALMLHFKDPMRLPGGIRFMPSDISCFKPHKSFWDFSRLLEAWKPRALTKTDVQVTNRNSRHQSVSGVLHESLDDNFEAHCFLLLQVIYMNSFIGFYQGCMVFRVCPFLLPLYSSSTCYYGEN